jgi:hypothetical protein
MANAYSTILHKLVQITQQFYLPVKFSSCRDVARVPPFRDAIHDHCPRVHYVMSETQGRNGDGLYNIDDPVHCSNELVCKIFGEEDQRPIDAVRSCTTTYRSIHGWHDNHHHLSLKEDGWPWRNLKLELAGHAWSSSLQSQGAWYWRKGRWRMWSSRSKIDLKKWFPLFQKSMLNVRGSGFTIYWRMWSVWQKY